jgi:hypothetical protein
MGPPLCGKSRGVTVVEVFRKARTSSQLIRNAALRRNGLFGVTEPSSPSTDEPLEISGIALWETECIASYM